MTKTTQDYARFIALMTDGMLYINPAVSFHVACLLMGADEASLGKMIKQETGFTPDGLIRSYRNSYRTYLFKEFGVKL